VRAVQTPATLCKRCANAVQSPRTQCGGVYFEHAQNKRRGLAFALYNKLNDRTIFPSGRKKRFLKCLMIIT